MNNEINRSRVILLSLGVLFLIIGAFATETRLVSFNIMDQSLESRHQDAREIAQLTIKFGRIGLSVVGGLFLLLAFALERIFNTNVAQKLYLKLPEPQEKLPLFGRSLWIMIFVFIVCIVTLVYWRHLVSEEIYYTYYRREEGFFELSTAFMLLVNSVFAGVLARKFRQSKMWLLSMTSLCILFFVAAGEELSWGQHLFRLEQLEVFSGNLQGENNLHNQFGYLADHIFILGVIIFGVMIPVISFILPTLGRFLRYIGLPVASSGLAIGFLLASLLQEYFLKVVFGLESTEMRPAEIREWMTIIGFTLLLIELWITRPGIFTSQQEVRE